ncbi:MAG TPA: crossover junction endodeoxyribonuclease RuvC [Candidatus Acidoferrum sp.]|nr:crossover junction endodeoxyribonuclease RuvC [Candidatus Acidoferrum sp.]
MAITSRQFEQLQNRTRRSAVPVLAPTIPARRHQVILGIDPSLRGTGFGILVIEKPISRALVCGTIRCPATWERSRCLARIAEVLRDVIRQHSPTVCAIEGLYFAQNIQTALIMGEARGASLVSAAEAGLEIYEVAPRKMKQAIVGYGAAQKDAVAKMVQRMLNLAEIPDPDAADALALALTYAQTNSSIQTTSARRI